MLALLVLATPYFVAKSSLDSSPRRRSEREAQERSPAMEPDSASKTAAETDTKVESEHPWVGELAVLSIDNEAAVDLASTRAVDDAYQKALKAMDVHGIRNLMQVGLVFSVEDGTTVRVIDYHLDRRQVRVLEGDHVGRSGWVYWRWVKRP